MLFKRKRLVNCNWVLLSHSKRHISCHLAFVPSQIWVVVYDPAFVCTSGFSADPYFLFYLWAHGPQSSFVVIQYPLKFSFRCALYGRRRWIARRKWSGFSSSWQWINFAETRLWKFVENHEEKILPAGAGRKTQDIGKGYRSSRKYGRPSEAGR